MVLSAVGAWLQPPSGDPYRPPQSGLAWWAAPPETNPDLRLVQLQGALNAAFAVQGTDVLWIVGDGGLALRSDDFGDELEIVTLPPDSVTALASARQIDPRQQLLPAPPSGSTVLFTADLVDVHFADTTVGWILSRRGTLFSTRDGGATWERARVTDGFGVLQEGVRIAFADRSVGYAVGIGQAFFTEDGGASWIDISEGAFGPLEYVFDVSLDPEGGLWVTTTDGPALSWRRNEGWVSRTEELGMSGDLFEVLPVITWRPDGSGVAARLEELPDSGPGASTILTSPSLGAQWTELRADSLVIFADEPIAGLLIDIRGIVVSSDRATLGTRLGVVPGYLGAIYALAGADDEGTVATRFPRASAPDESRAVIVGTDGVHRSHDGGRTWRPLNRASLRAVAFTTPERGWAVGDGGVLLQTNDGGASWWARPSGTHHTLRAIHFLDESRGFAVGDDGLLLATTDGGASWSTSRLEPNLVLEAIGFEDGGNRVGWILGMDIVDNTAVGFRSENGGLTWSRVGALEETLIAARSGLLDRASFAAVEDSDHLDWLDASRLFASEPPPYDEQADLARYRIVDPGAGDSLWLAAPNGLLLTTTDRGLTFDTIDTGQPFDVYDLAIVPRDAGPGRMVAVGRGGLIVRSDDGGATWTGEREHGHAPAPWYYLTWIVGLVLLVQALKPVPPMVHESIARVGASDRPLRRGDPDPLGFNALAAGLSRFLRNEATEPPLTIAVTGPWGSGKSSLMNLLAEDLREYRRHPVWFNAWHHQKEEHLLAALLENVRRQGVPPWWRWRGLRFRIRLLQRRSAADWWKILSLTFVLALSSTYYVRHSDSLGEVPSDVAAHVLDLLPFGDFEGDPHGGGAWLLPLAGILGTAGPLSLGFLRALVAFRVSPASLLSTESASKSGGKLRDQLGFRHTFSDEFDDVTWALQPRTLVILIDDLDRCQPTKVLEVLEAVNFLASVGECHIILGMDMTQVERSVGLGFKDVVEDFVEQDAPPDSKPANGAPTAVASGNGGKEGKSTGSSPAARRLFAQRYLEKLVNIVVPVPPPTRTGSLRLLVDEKDDAARSTTAIAAARLRRTGRAVGDIWPVLAVLGIAFVGLVTGRLLPAAADVERVAPIVVTTPTSSGPTGLGTGDDRTPTQRPSDFDAGTPSDSVLFADTRGPSRPVSVLLLLIPAALLATWGVSSLLTEAEDVERDSPTFERALAAWHPLITRASTNPRTLKRFKNRVRYYAMVQGPARQEGGGAQEAPEVESIPEDVLVALSSLQHCVTSGDVAELLGDPKAYLLGLGDVSDEAIAAFLEHGGIDRIEGYRKRFETLVSGVERL